MQRARLKRGVVGGLILWAVIGGFGCSSEAGSNEPASAVPQPVAPECTADKPCIEGRLCLSGRCYPACSSDVQCSSRERCVQSGGQRGVCVAQSDASAPEDPCAGQVCGGTTPVCHPTAGSCVACSADEHCAGATPVCDRGRGTCVASAVALCAACETAADCGAAGDAGGPALSCVELGHPFEKVCLRGPCAQDADCPTAFECLPSLKVCIPRRGSCTAYRAAVLARTCSEDADCSALDVAPGAPESGICHLGHCAFGCVATPDCPGSRVCTPPVCEGNDRDSGALVQGV
ncbi:MAG: hypothetical protein QM778_11260 [Myxococcales bacterium]